MLVFFGYQTPNIPRFAPKMNREKLQDIILGVVIGALNGYLIAGTIWFYMADAGYPFTQVITPPLEILPKLRRQCFITCPPTCSESPAFTSRL